MDIKNSRFSRTYTLRQHTPLIHFQAEQKGATLRATEVKAKLDKYVNNVFVKYLPPDESEKITSFFDNREKVNSVYSLAIKELGPPRRFLVSSYLSSKQTDAIELKNEFGYIKNAPYFAMENEIKKKFFSEIIGTDTLEIVDNWESAISYWGVYWKDGIELTFTSFKSGFFDELERIIPAFLANHNFGTRQTKGLGCFTLSTTGQKDFEKQIIQNQNNVCIYKKELNGNNDPLEVLNMDYRYLKAGFNPPNNDYYKSELWLYLCSVDNNSLPKINWEKKKIKEILSSDEKYKEVWEAIERTYKYKPRKKDLEDHRLRQGFTAYYIRALLGLAEQFDFTVGGGRKISIKVKDEADEVDRAPSPILFKVFDNTIYLIGRRMPDHLWQRIEKDGNGNQVTAPREFGFYLYTSGFPVNYKGKGDKKSRLFTLQVPNDFKIENFLAQALGDSSPINSYKLISTK